jgi:hypothetical protein
VRRLGKHEGKAIVCPKCGEWGTLVYRITNTGNYTYRYWYCRHYREGARDSYCYIGKTYPPKPTPKHKKLDEFFNF